MSLPTMVVEAGVSKTPLVQMSEPVAEVAAVTELPESVVAEALTGAVRGKRGRYVRSA